MPGEIKPIPTVYQGYRFRSRLEARWAVFLDVLGVRWAYEDEGYLLPIGSIEIPYLPDFWIESWSIFLEIKPWLKHLDLNDFGKMDLLADNKGPSVILYGQPFPGEHLAFVFNYEARISVTAGEFAQCGECNVIAILPRLDVTDAITEALHLDDPAISRVDDPVISRVPFDLDEHTFACPGMNQSPISGVGRPRLRDAFFAARQIRFDRHQ